MCKILRANDCFFKSERLLWMICIYLQIVWQCHIESLKVPSSIIYYDLPSCDSEFLREYSALFVSLSSHAIIWKLGKELHSWFISSFLLDKTPYKRLTILISCYSFWLTDQHKAKQNIIVRYTVIKLLLF